MAALGDPLPPSLADVLVRQNLITRSQLERALESQRETAQSLGRTVVEMAMISERALINVLQNTYGFELLDLKKTIVDPSVAELIPRPFADKHRAIPIRREGRAVLIVAMEDPSDLVAIDAIRHQVGSEIRPVIATAEDIKTLLGERAGAEAQPPRVTRGPIYRILSYSLFPLLLIAPLVGFLLLVRYSDDFYRVLMGGKATPWDIGIYTGLAWGVWAILLYEINGIVFGKAEGENES